MMNDRAVLVFTLAVVLLMTACGGGGHSVSVNDVASETRGASSARVSLETKLGEQVVQNIAGQADLSQRRFHFDFKHADGSDIELIVIGYDGYQRPASAKGAAPADWCSMGRVEGLNVDFGAILESLGSSSGKLVKAGTESVRGVETTHYRVASTDPVWDGTQLWVDKDNRVRRLVQQSDTDTGKRTDTAEFYDFGAPMSPITAPQAKKACPPPSE